MDEYGTLARVLEWIRVPAILVGTYILIRVIHSRISNRESLKVQSIKSEMHDEVERGETWSSPLLNNAGFAISVFLASLSLALILPGFLASGSSIVLIGVWIAYQTPYIELTRNSLRTQPLLFKMIRVPVLKKELQYSEIEAVKKDSPLPPFWNLKVETHTPGHLMLRTSLYASEVGSALYEFLNEASSLHRNRLGLNSVPRTK